MSGILLQTRTFRTLVQSIRSSHVKQFRIRDRFGQRWSHSSHGAYLQIYSRVRISLEIPYIM